MVADRGHPELLFKEFLQAEGFPDVIAAYHRLCDALDISAQDHDTFYDKLKDNVKTNEAVSLWKLLDSKAQQKVYEGGNICKKQKVRWHYPIVSASLCLFLNKSFNSFSFCRCLLWELAPVD